MSRNKAIIGSDESEYVERTDTAERLSVEARSELTMIRRRIRTFFSAVTQVRFPANPPAWAEDWPEWLETGTVAVDVAAEEAAEETLGEEPAGPPAA